VSSLSALRQQLAEIIDGAASATPGLPTGIEALDGLLPGGVPRGRLTEILGRRGSGKTTLVRRIVEATVAAELWVAYIDAARTLAPRDWAHLGEREGVWMVRPRDAARAHWCADVLLRSGAFSLVVVDGAPPLPRGVAVRLTRLARESDAAFLVIGDEGSATMLGGALRLRVTGRTVRRAGTHHSSATPSKPAAPTTVRRLAIAVEKGGTHRTAEVSCTIEVPRRLCTHADPPDRRGAAKKTTSALETAVARARGG
jgi:hypothetical protein